MQRREFLKSLIATGGALAVAQHAHGLTNDPAPRIERVLVMFKCHFDCGFIDTQAHVIAKYFDQYFPQAIALSAAQRASGGDRYVWTTGSWLVYEYLEKAAPAQRKQMEQAIASGDIAWHALPFSWQTELLDRSMIEGAIGLSQSLDRRFGRTTTGAKMTDVPGHTRGIIDPIAAHGVTFLDIGVNDASTPAEVPPIFLWRSSQGGELTVMYHLGYGGVALVPGSNLAVSIEVRGDNSGPHTPEEIRQIYAGLRQRFPNATVIATNLADIANAVLPYRKSLPVVTQEIGDTWIYGVPSDPVKIARYRAVARMRGEWLAQRKFAVGDAIDVALLRSLLLEAEHTWGTDTKTWLDFDHYTPDDLKTMLDTKNYKVVEFSWEEKRKDLFDAVATLPAALRSEAQTGVDELAPKRPSSAGLTAHPAGEDIETAHFVIGIDPHTGAIRKLRQKKSGRDWASPQNPLALFSYQTLSSTDYDRFFKSYVVSTADWAKKDFGKPNIERFGAQSRTLMPALKSLMHTREPMRHRLLAALRIDDPAKNAGWPGELYLELILPDAEPVIEVNFSWFQKPVNRMPEAMWLTFQPITPDAQGWSLNKSGQQISPFDVVPGGNRHMHAVDTGLGYEDAQGRLVIDTLDAPVVALGEREPVYFSNQQPDLTQGVHFSLFNNGWGTNYIQWFGEDMRFRFRLQLA